MKFLYIACFQKLTFNKKTYIKSQLKWNLSLCNGAWRLENFQILNLEKQVSRNESETSLGIRRIQVLWNQEGKKSNMD